VVKLTRVKFLKRRRWRAVTYILAALLIYGALMFSLQRLILYPRHAARPLPNPGQGVSGLLRLTVESDQGPVEGFYLPGEGASAARPGPAVIFAHGNAELIDYWPGEMARYRRMGLGVLLPEYRGYGRSAGSPGQEAITADLLHFHDWLVARPEVDPKRIVYHGRSLGGGAVCALAVHRPPAALVLQSTFTSIRRMARRFLMPGFLVRDPYDNLTVVRGLSCPVLVVHGRRDSLIPFAHAEDLRAAAGDRARLVAYPEADHNNCPPDWTAFWDEVERFLREARIVR
jgi:fermentation-respiration switch protein FrsA (DUF1100 family)